MAGWLVGLAGLAGFAGPDNLADLAGVSGLAGVAALAGLIELTRELMWLTLSNFQNVSKTCLILTKTSFGMSNVIFLRFVNDRKSEFQRALNSIQKVR